MTRFLSMDARASARSRASWRRFGSSPRRARARGFHPQLYGGMEVTTRKRSDEALAVMASKLVRIALTCSPRIVRVPRFTFASPQAPMKILFVHPGPLLYTNVFLRFEPYVLDLVAEAARRAGHSVRLVDLQVESHSDYRRMIAEWRPDLIAFSCNYLANVPEIVDLAKATKLALP